MPVNKFLSFFHNCFSTNKNIIVDKQIVSEHKMEQ